MYNFYKLKMLWSYLDQGSSLTFSLAGQSGQPKSGLAGPRYFYRFWSADNNYPCPAEYLEVLFKDIF